jgi:hypothetical protein
VVEYAVKIPVADGSNCGTEGETVNSFEVRKD